SRAFPERMTASTALDALVSAGRLGRKSGAGFYRHRGRQRVVDRELRGVLGLSRERPVKSLYVLAERMVMAMIAESVRCLEDQVVGDAGMLDLAMIFGAGFPPFRGGPLRHADTLGLSRVESRMNALRAEKGERF